MLLSSTSISDASGCLKKYQYRWVDGLVPHPKNVSTAMRRGIWLHRCLEEYHKGGEWRVALMDLHEWAMEHGVDGEKILEIHHECERIMESYIDFWPAQAWTVLGTEVPIKLDFGDGSGVRATIDFAVRWGQQMWLVENKSTADIPPASWRAVDPQTALQYWLCHYVKPVIGGEPFLPVGVIFNYVLTKPPGKPRWKKNGELYANCGATTDKVFLKAALERINGGESISEFDGDRHALVNDDLFYKRYPVERPSGDVQTTMQDIVALLRDLKTAEQHQWYRRSLNVMSCRRFCTYQEICAHEYRLGGPSETLRNELFVPDDGTKGEGR